MAVYYQANLTMRQLAALFGCSPATVCRSSSAWDRSWQSSRRPAPPTQRTGLDRGRHPDPGPESHRRSFLPQLPILRERAGHHRRRHQTGHRDSPSVPGRTADAKAWRDSGLAGICEGVTVLGDCRQRGNGLHDAVQAVATLHNHALAHDPHDTGADGTTTVRRPRPL
ncbi:hypothetical protein [Streptomyces sp. NPDC088261]|uniref:hypothetical protein n=1 Tax=Streptomyces sp. NPDC088261 TaxID=3365851 RepID=UPI0038305AA3